jgi:hypothetical protein
MTYFRELPAGEWCAGRGQISFELAMMCSFKTLRTLFGDPRDPSKISYNSRYEWNVEDVDSNVCCAIYEWISKGVALDDYPSDVIVRNAPAYKWNIGAASMEGAQLLLMWLQTRDPSVKRVADWADPIPAINERKKYIMAHYKSGQLKDMASKYHLVVPIGMSRKELVDAIVEAEYGKKCPTE